MTTKTKDERLRVNERLAQMESKLDGLRGQLQDLRDEADDLENEIAAVRKAYPPLPEVMRVEVDGVAWFTDGWRAMRDAWSEECDTESRPAPTVEAMRKLIEEWHATNAPAEIAEGADTWDGEAFILSSGAIVMADLLQPFMGRGLVFHSSADHMPVVIKTEAGEVMGCAMPRRVEPKSRRPYQAADAGPRLVCVACGGPEVSPFNNPPVCDTCRTALAGGQ